MKNLFKYILMVLLYNSLQICISAPTQQEINDKYQEVVRITTEVAIQDWFDQPANHQWFILFDLNQQLALFKKFADPAFSDRMSHFILHSIIGRAPSIYLNMLNLHPESINTIFGHYIANGFITILHTSTYPEPNRNLLQDFNSWSTTNFDLFKQKVLVPPIDNVKKIIEFCLEHQELNSLKNQISNWAKTNFFILQDATAKMTYLFTWNLLLPKPSNLWITKNTQQFYTLLLPAIDKSASVVQFFNDWITANPRLFIQTYNNLAQAHSVIEKFQAQNPWSWKQWLANPQNKTLWENRIRRHTTKQRISGGRNAWQRKRDALDHATFNAMQVD